MKKYQLDLRVYSNHMVSNNATLLTLQSDQPLPDMVAGQFAELQVPSAKVLLRRPISIHAVDRKENLVEFLIQIVGQGTESLASLKAGDTVNVLLPLGNGFSYRTTHVSRPLLVGGGVGVAPLLYMGAEMAKKGMEPTFLLGARTSKDLLMLDIFKRYGRVCVTTEDGSEGEKGFVTNHSLLQTEQFTRIATCGPTPMMKAVAEFARKTDVECEVSLENLMACGLGACLCCVEKTTEGNLCVCKDGPVFNIRKLLWQV